MNLGIKGENISLTLFSNQHKNAEQILQYSICTYFLPGLLASEQALQTRQVAKRTAVIFFVFVGQQRQGHGKLFFTSSLSNDLHSALTPIPLRATKKNYACFASLRMRKYESWEKKEEGTGMGRRTGKGRGEIICHSSYLSLLPCQPLHQRQTPPESFQQLSVYRLLLYCCGLTMSILRENQQLNTVLPVRYVRSSFHQ